MSEPIDRVVVEQTLPGKRLDVFLRTKFPMISRGTIQRLIEQGDILVNGQPTKATHHPRAGEQIEIRWPEARASEVKPQEIPLDILFEDEDLLILNKPPGIVVHPSAGHDDSTLVNALLHHCRGQLSGIGGVARPGIVHRLDKDTSGCLVVAKSDPTHLGLSRQFAARSVQKVYHALLCGELDREEGEIRAAIARHPSHRKRMAVTDGRGRDAWTTYRVLERLHGATLAEALLHTGRTHQIRVHFQHIGFPLVGDVTYGKRHNARLRELTNFTAPRQMLHAWKVVFEHPATGEEIVCEAPWPVDFHDAVAALRPHGPNAQTLKS
ncbi:MAG: RluA family pseudouridine synthase [Verrucomicrobiota bacterium]